MVRYQFVDLYLDLLAALLDLGVRTRLEIFLITTWHSVDHNLHLQLKKGSLKRQFVTNLIFVVLTESDLNPVEKIKKTVSVYVLFQ